MLDRLISHLIETRPEDLSPELFLQAKRCVIDWVGVTLGGSIHPAISILTDTIRDLSGGPQASVFGTPMRTSALYAALANGTMSHVLDYDDTHLGAFMHPSAPVLPALFAYGEWKQVSGRDFLTAFLLGFEVETRISMAMGEPHYDAGWHSTATMGRFGAAAGVAKLAGLNREQTAHALGLAGTQASGIRKVFGAMAKSFHPGKAAADGLLSVLLARGGYTSSMDILGGEKGLGAVFSTDYNPERGLEGLGESYTIWGVSFKPFASCLYTHPVIDGVIQLRNRHGIAPEAVESIRVGVCKVCADAACQQNPQTGLAGKFSTYYCAALALVQGRAGEDLFQDEKMRDSRVLSLMQRVSVEPMPDLTPSQARVSIRLNDGTMHDHQVDHPLGSPEKPLSDTQLEEKAAGLLELVFEKERVRGILDTLRTLESLDSISELTPLLMKSS